MYTHFNKDKGMSLANVKMVSRKREQVDQVKSWDQKQLSGQPLWGCNYLFFIRKKNKNGELQAEYSLWEHIILQGYCFVKSSFQMGEKGEGCRVFLKWLWKFN